MKQALKYRLVPKSEKRVITFQVTQTYMAKMHQVYRSTDERTDNLRWQLYSAWHYVHRAEKKLNAWLLV